jgi:drug/metabolite transporter (DMT)-like permease
MKYTWLFFVAGAVLSWGAYVVTIDHGRTKLAEGLPRTHMAVAAMMNKPPAGQDPGFNMKGSVLSTVAGILGAAGALCIVFAVGSARRSGGAQAALYVAPLVFAFAPIVNVIISMIWDRGQKTPSPMFFIGLILAVGGAALVLIYKPAETPHAAPVRGFPVVQQQAK